MKKYTYLVLMFNAALFIVHNDSLCGWAEDFFTLSIPPELKNKHDEIERELTQLEQYEGSEYEQKHTEVAEKARELQIAKQLVLLRNGIDVANRIVYITGAKNFSSDGPSAWELEGKLEVLERMGLGEGPITVRDLEDLPKCN